MKRIPFKAWQRVMRLFLIMVFLLPVSFISAQEPMIWICNAPPVDLPGRVMPSGMHKISAERGQRGRENFLQFVREGEDFYSAAWLDSASVATLSLKAFLPDAEPLRLGLSARRQYAVLSYDGSAEGYHYLYAVKEYSSDSMTYTDIAAAERLQHKCMNGHAHVKGMLSYQLFPDVIPLEIRRERYTREDFHTFVSSGDKVILRAFFRGEPVSGVRVRIRSQEGWTLERISDENGKAEFNMAGDYYSPIADLDDRQRSTFLIVAEYAPQSEGGTHIYRYSLTDDYWPSAILYRARTLPWILTMAVVLTGILAIVVVRRRKTRPYKNIRFDER